MEIIKTIMIGLGISTTLWLVVKGAKYGTASKIEVRLNAPLFSQKKHTIVVINQANQTGIVMMSMESEENKRLLGKYIELLS